MLMYFIDNSYMTCEVERLNRLREGVFTCLALNNRAVGTFEFQDLNLLPDCALRYYIA